MIYYHYTSIESFRAIVNSGKIWFGSLAFMNDRREGYAVRQFLENALGEIDSSEEMKAYKELMEEAAKIYQRYQYAFCASTLEDDLSQWRAYTELGHGLCIGFQAPFIGSEDVDSFSCIYSNEEKDAGIDEVFSEPEAVGEAEFRKLTELMAKFKAESFTSEKETRWVTRVSGLADLKAKRIRYRAHRLGLAPYVEISVDLSQVVSVTLGPEVPGENKYSVDDFMIQSGCGGSVLTSKSSLR